MAVIVVCVLLTVGLQATLSTTESNITRYRDLPIRYPGPVKPVDVTRYEQTPPPAATSTADEDVPNECRHLDYCTVKPNNYPEQEIKELFKNKKVALPPPDLEVNLIIGNRQGDPNEEDNCPSDVTYEPIYKLKHNSKWQTVVQAPELAYEQKVRMERCRDQAGKACFTIAIFPANVRAKCVQKFSTWKLQILDENKKPTMKEVDLPSCCSCHYGDINN